MARAAPRVCPEVGTHSRAAGVEDGPEVGAPWRALGAAAARRQVQAVAWRTSTRPRRQARRLRSQHSRRMLQVLLPWMGLCWETSTNPRVPSRETKLPAMPPREISAVVVVVPRAPVGAAVLADVDERMIRETTTVRKLNEGFCLWVCVGGPHASFTSKRKTITK